MNHLPLIRPAGFVRVGVCHRAVLFNVVEGATTKELIDSLKMQGYRCDQVRRAIADLFRCGLIQRAGWTNTRYGRAIWMLTRLGGEAVDDTDWWRRFIT